MADHAKVYRNQRLLTKEHPGTMQPKAGRKYYTLLERTPGELWAPQFGDYEREVVEQEQRDMKDSGSFTKGTKFLIIETGTRQYQVSDAIRLLNDELAPIALKEKKR
jgi:hypothetical protein